MSLKILFLGFFLVLHEASAKSVRFQVRDAAQRDIVEFASETPLEKVVGLTNAVAGWIELDPDAVNSGVKGEFELDVRTFDTGSPARNEYLREKFLSTSEFPYANFTIGKLLSASKTKLADQKPSTLRLEGNLKLKGISKPLTVLAKVTYFKEGGQSAVRAPGNLLKLSCSFDVDSSQFGITLPESFKFRIARYIQVTADVIGSDGPGPSLIALPETAVKPK